MKVVNSSDTRRSQNILIGLVKPNYEPQYRSDSAPLNDHSESSFRNIPRSKSSMGNRLSLFGLPEDTFDRTVIMTDLDVFCKRVRRLQKILELPEARYIISDMDLRALHRQLKKDLNLIKITQYNEQWQQNSLTRNNSQPDFLKTLANNKARRHSEIDNEVSNINRHPSVPNLLNNSYRSSSSLSTFGNNSKIPVKAPLTERPLSKMEMRIQRRISCDSNRAPIADNLRILQRKHSVDPSNNSYISFNEEF